MKNIAICPKQSYQSGYICMCHVQLWAKTAAKYADQHTVTYFCSQLYKTSLSTSSTFFFVQKCCPIAPIFLQLSTFYTSLKTLLDLMTAVHGFISYFWVNLWSCFLQRNVSVNTIVLRL